MNKGFYPLCFADDEGEMQSGKDEGIHSVAYFSNDEFEELFDKSKLEVKDWFTKRKNDQDGFDFDEGLPKGPNGEENVVLWSNFSESPEDLQVYSYDDERGDFPNRFQDREDYTDWLMEIFDE